MNEAGKQVYYRVYHLLSWVSINGLLWENYGMETENINILLGKRLKDLRRKKKITQEELAYLADLEYKYIQRLESKKPSSPTLNTLQKLAKAFKISIPKLLNSK